MEREGEVDIEGRSLVCRLSCGVRSSVLPSASASASVDGEETLPRKAASTHDASYKLQLATDKI